MEGGALSVWPSLLASVGEPLRAAHYQNHSEEPAAHTARVRTSVAVVQTGRFGFNLFADEYPSPEAGGGESAQSLFNYSEQAFQCPGSPGGTKSDSESPGRSLLCCSSTIIYSINHSGPRQSPGPPSPPPCSSTHMAASPLPLPFVAPHTLPWPAQFWGAEHHCTGS